MSRGLKIVLIIAIVLLLLGLILVGAGFLLGGSSLFGDTFSGGLASKDVERKTVTVTDAFENILVEEITADVALVSAQDGVCKVEYGETKDVTLTVQVENGTLKVSRKDSEDWYKKITLFGSRSLGTTKIYLPEQLLKSVELKAVSGDVSIETAVQASEVKLSATTGDVRVEAALQADAITLSATTGSVRVKAACTADTMTLSATTGDVRVEAACAADTVELKAGTGDVVTEMIAATNVNAKAGTGDVRLKDVVAEQTLSASCTTGKVVLERCDADGTVTLHATTGDIKATLKSGKRFEASSSTGDVHVPASEDGAALCTASTTTGDINISIAP